MPIPKDKTDRKSKLGDFVEVLVPLSSDVDLSKLLYQAPARAGVAIRNSERQDHGLETEQGGEQAVAQRGDQNQANGGFHDTTA